MKTYVIAGSVCVLFATAVTSCALGMFLQSKRAKPGPDAIVTALKDPNRNETVKALGQAAANDPVVAQTLSEALQEREVAVAARDMVAKARDQKSRDQGQADAMKRKHRRLMDEALLSLAKGDLEDAKLSFDLARSFDINDPESRALEMKFETALMSVKTAQKNAPKADLQAQQPAANTAPATKKAPARNAGDQNPFE
jgi:hypothetical protein